MKQAQVPLDDTVLYESHDTFSAWPIRFGKVDTVGLLFDKDSNLEPPFDHCYISFTFYAQEGGAPRALPRPTTLMTALVGAVLRWRISKEGLWVRFGFAETPQYAKDLPIKSVQDKLRTAIKQNRIGLTYASYEIAKQRTVLVPIDEKSHYVKHFPVLAFALYEKVQEPNEPKETLPTGSSLQVKQ